MIVQNGLRPPFVCLLATLALAVLPTFPCLAQSDWLDEAHVVPLPSSDRVVRTSPGEPTLSASLKPFRSDVDLVLVPVTVTDSFNRPVLDVSQHEFTLYEDSVPQPIQYFSREDAPISIALVLDYSASMKNKIEYEQEAVKQFFIHANPDDEYFIITVSSKPKLIASSTQSIGTIEERLGATKPQGATALYDAIYLGINKLRTARYQRRALLIISDGGDNHSRYSLKETRHMIEEANVLTYGIGIFDDMPVPLLKTVEERLGRQSLAKLTDASGGRTIPADDRRQIPQIAGLISRELRDQYMLGYRPTNQNRDGKWHKIRVRLSATAALRHVYYREGYLAPEQ
jgi:Ca-activated chloride channel homolog